jgi:hypothetical protein
MAVSLPLSVPRLLRDHQPVERVTIPRLAPGVRAALLVMLIGWPTLCVMMLAAFLAVAEPYELPGWAVYLFGPDGLR